MKVKADGKKKAKSRIRVWRGQEKLVYNRKEVIRSILSSLIPARLQLSNFILTGITASIIMELSCPNKVNHITISLYPPDRLAFDCNFVCRKNPLMFPNKNYGERLDEMSFQFK